MDSFAQKILRQNSLALNLRPVFIGQLALLEVMDSEAYAYKDGSFEIALKKNGQITPEFLKNYSKNCSKEIYISELDFNNVQKKIGEQLLKLTRSQSIGDALRNSSRQANLLSLQMANLYDNPFDDELLKNQYQSSKNFSSLLFNNKEIHSSLYNRYQKQNHHYIIGQPFLSSMLLLSFIQHTKMFNEKEIQNLFLTSYFKDIGKSFIPREKFETQNLEFSDKQIFGEHSDRSVEILQGRLPLNKTQLNIIKNHHFLNHIVQAKILGRKVDLENNFLTGVESALLSSIDILVAMTSQRPYREPISYFKALEFLKLVLQDEYPTEFKSLVLFLKRFFKNN